jgi:hypothetical protein
MFRPRISYEVTANFLSASLWLLLCISLSSVPCGFADPPRGSRGHGRPNLLCRNSNISNVIHQMLNPWAWRVGVEAIYACQLKVIDSLDSVW